MSVNIKEASDTAKVSYRWDLVDFPDLEQVQSGRRVAIKPHRIEISTDRSRHSGRLYVLIEGQTVRRNGTPGQHRRGIVFSDEPIYFGEPMELLPVEYIAFLDAARSAEVAR
jgi:hypothetical protein